MKIKGLKKIATDTLILSDFYAPEYLQLNYDISTGEAWTDFHYSLGHNSWTNYHDSKIINCGIITNPMSVREISKMIENLISERSQNDELRSDSRYTP